MTSDKTAAKYRTRFVRLLSWFVRENFIGTAFITALSCPTAFSVAMSLWQHAYYLFSVVFLIFGILGLGFFVLLIMGKAVDGKGWFDRKNRLHRLDGWWSGFENLALKELKSISMGISSLSLHRLKMAELCKAEARRITDDYRLHYRAAALPDLDTTSLESVRGLMRNDALEKETRIRLKRYYKNRTQLHMMDRELHELQMRQNVCEVELEIFKVRQKYELQDEIRESVEATAETISRSTGRG